MKLFAATPLRVARACPKFALPLIAALIPARAAVTLPNDLGEIRFTNTVAAVYDTNIYATSQAVSDVTLKNDIVADYTHATRALTLRGEVAWSLGWFERNSNLSYGDPRLSLRIARPSGKLTGEVEMSGTRSHEANGLLGIRTDKTVYRSGANCRYSIIPRYSLTGAVNFEETRYATAGLQNPESVSGSVGIDYSLTPKSDLVFAVNGGQTHTQIAGLATDLGFNVGATGRFTRKLKGDLHVGVSSRRNDYAKVDDTTLWTDMSMTWDFSRRASWSASLSRQAQTLATGQNSISNNASVSTRYQFNKQWTLSGGASGGWTQFLGATNRSDDHVGASADLSYRWGEHWTFGLNASIARNHSNEISTARYTQQTIGLRAGANW